MGKIYLTHHPEHILDQFPKHSLRVFEAQEFKIANAKEVIYEAYIFDQDGKIIALVGKIFNIEAQNALLKILEEPPQGVEFLILTPNKNALLPTIRSRMQIINTLEKKEIPPLSLDLKHLTLQSIFDFLKSLDSLSRTQNQEVLESLLKAIQQHNIKLHQDQLEFFNSAIEANLHYEKLHLILAPILLSLMENNR